MSDPRLGRVEPRDPSPVATKEPPPAARTGHSVTAARARGDSAAPVGRSTADLPGDTRRAEAEGASSVDTAGLAQAWGAAPPTRPAAGDKPSPPPAAGDKPSLDAVALKQISATLDQVEQVIKTLEAGKGTIPPAQVQEMAGMARSLLQQAEHRLNPDKGPPPSADLKKEYEGRTPFVKFGPQKRAGGSGVLSDIESHLPARYGSTYRDPDPVTWGHETTHGINSHLRNADRSGREVNGFYVGQDRAIVLQEPPMSKSSVARYVPASLRGSRFGMYVTGQRSFEGQPLYLFDEWTAYTNGGKVGVEMARNGQWRQGGRDAVAGIVEFTGYGFAMARALEAQRPGYLDSHPDLKNFLAWQGLNAMDTFREGIKITEFSRFPEQHRILRNLQSSADAEPLRDFIRRTWGDAYLQRLLYGAP